MRYAFWAALVLVWSAGTSTAAEDPVGRASTWALDKLRPWVSDVLRDRSWDIKGLQLYYNRNSSVPVELSFTNVGPDVMEDVKVKLMFAEEAGTFTYTDYASSVSVEEISGFLITVKKGESPAPLIKLPPGHPYLRDPQGEFPGHVMETLLSMDAVAGNQKHVAEIRAIENTIKKLPEPKGPGLSTSLCISSYNGRFHTRRYMLLLFKLTPTKDPNLSYFKGDDEYAQKLVASADDQRCEK